MKTKIIDEEMLSEILSGDDDIDYEMDYEKIDEKHLRPSLKEIDMSPEMIISKINQLCEHSIISFFSDKVDFNGNKIEEKELLRDENKNIVLSYCIMKNIDSIYETLAFLGLDQQYDKTEVEEPITYDVKYVVKIIHDCESKKIPKCFQTGLIYMYIKYCDGIYLDDSSTLRFYE